MTDGVGGNRVCLGEFVAGVAVKFDLDEEIQFGVVEEPTRDAVIEEMPEDRMTFHEVVFDQRCSFV